MFNILKYRNSIKLTAYTDSIIAYKAAPIVESKRHFPEWIKTIDKTGKLDEQSLTDIPTMTACTGFINLYKKGIVIPTWSDIRVKVGKQGTTSYQWAASNNHGRIDVHPDNQRGDYADQLKYQHLKIVMPWLLYSEDNCDWAWMPTPYASTELPEYTTLTGVMNYTKHHEANVNLLVPRKQEDTIINLPVNTPIAQAIPLTEKKLILETKLIDSSEYQSRIDSNMSHAVFSNFNKVKAQNKCPFHRK